MIASMTQWLCRCGETLQSSASRPNPSEWLLISDQDFDSLTDLVQAEDGYSAKEHVFAVSCMRPAPRVLVGMDVEPSVYVSEVRA